MSAFLVLGIAAFGFAPPTPLQRHILAPVSRSAVTCLAKGFGSAPKKQPKKKPQKKKAAGDKSERMKRAFAQAGLLPTQKAADPTLAPGASRRDGASAAAARRVDVDLGRGASVAVMLPEAAEGDISDADAESMSPDELVERFGSLTGAGDVVWPAGLAFSRMLAHCPSFVAGKRVLELGSGIGAVGLVAATSGARSVLLTDYDEEVLRFAREGATANAVDGVVSTTRLDWSQTDELPPGGPWDVVLAADVLYAEQNALNIARLLPRLLEGAEGARCLIADQTQWPWRRDFEAACAEGGLAVEDVPLPGPEDVRLLSVMREG